MKQAIPGHRATDPDQLVFEVLITISDLVEHSADLRRDAVAGHRHPPAKVPSMYRPHRG